MLELDLYFYKLDPRYLLLLKLQLGLQWDYNFSEYRALRRIFVLLQEAFQEAKEILDGWQVILG